MALLSDIDWVILLGVAAFFLFGQGSGATVRTLGRYYGRAMRLKQELLAEFTRAADLPTAPGGRPMSIRQALLGFDEGGRPVSGIPAAVTVAPTAAPAVALPVGSAYVGPGTWSLAVPSVPAEPRGTG